MSRFNLFVVCVMVASASTGCGREDQGLKTDPVAEMAVTQTSDRAEELRAKWNTAVQGMKPTAHMYKWNRGEFPHPTYGKGTADEYATYAEVLLVVFESEETFNWAKEHKLFDAEMLHITGGKALNKPKKTPDGRIEIEGFTYTTHTLRQIFKDLSASDAYGVTDADRARLRVLYDKTRKGILWGAFDKK